MSAMGCPEVVYQAYYPYLYQRAAAAGAARQPPFPPFSHHYDRGAHSQRGLDATGAPPDGFLAHHSSSGSVSSGGGGVGSPGSPPRRKEVGACAEADDDDGDDGDDETRSRAQYLSANCVVFTHYSGDVEAVVDQHFTRALSDFAADKPSSAHSQHDKLETSPMSARNFPASFWNSSYQGPAPTHYEAYHGAAGDPWHSHYQQYTVAAHHHRAVQEYHHHHNMAAQYGGLLLPASGARIPAHHAAHAAHAHAYAKPEPWPSAHARLHHDAPAHAAHALDAPYAAYPGLDAQAQESKDLYWF